MWRRGTRARNPEGPIALVREAGNRKQQDRSVGDPPGCPTRSHHVCYHDGMERTTISLPEELLDRLRIIAAERRTSMAELVREAIQEKVAEHRPRPRSLGIGASGHDDTASRTGDERPEPRSWR